MLARSLTLVLPDTGWSDRDLKLSADIEQLNLTSPTDVKVGVGKRWFCRSMAQDVANVAILSDHVLKIVFKVKEAVRGVKSAEELGLRMPSLAAVASILNIADCTHACSRALCRNTHVCASRRAPTNMPGHSNG